jgi:hypothetical protein
MPVYEWLDPYGNVAACHAGLWRVVRLKPVEAVEVCVFALLMNVADCS